MNLTLDLLYKINLTNGDQWNAGHAVIEIHVFDRICMLSFDRRREC